MKWERKSGHKGLLDINTIKNGGNIKVQNTGIFLIYRPSKTNAIKETSTTKKTTTVRNIHQHSTTFHNRKSKCKSHVALPMRCKSHCSTRSSVTTTPGSNVFEHSSNHYPKSDPKHHTDLVIKIMETLNIIT
jgi:hypothetical protein